jgi:hypothetical protein
VSGAVRTKRRRSATESLLSITLALEAVLVFFVALTAFALRIVDPLVAFAGGVLFIAALALCARLVRYPVGVAIGWVLQVALVATGLLLPIMFAIGAGFFALWTFCFVKGRSLDRASANSTTELETE